VRPIAQKPGDAGSPPWIWIVDDSAMEAAIARRALEPGYRVEVFSDGASAIELLATGARPDLLILDWVMPSMSGLEVCRFIRETLDHGTLPILILTALDHTQELVEGLRAGANDFVRKAFDQAELEARVATILRSAALLRTVRDAERREREAREEAEEANRTKDEFLAVVSHELRTPLNAILGWARMLRNPDVPRASHGRALEIIERNAAVQVQLIEDILDVSRIISGKLRLDLAPVDLGHVIRHALEASKPAADAKSITVIAEIDPAAVSVVGDPDRLQQIVWNLMSNAVKFSGRDGRVKVSVTAEDGYRKIVVEDDGRGITADFLPHVFERFRQAEGSTTRRYGGLGLGLSLVSNLVEMHGGTIAAASEGEGKGARFTILLPIHAIEDAGPSSTASPSRVEARAAKQALPGIRVLVVDDDPDARELVGEVLRAEGAVVSLAESVVTALEALEQFRPDVLLSDIAMAGADGYDLIRAIRALPAERGGMTPAAALTAYAREEDRNRAVTTGFQTHLAKPLEPAALLEAVARLAAKS
jgi:signal transduction histidine kinase